jgi:hypothetical protein
MRHAILGLFAFSFISLSAHAGQVVMSCDLLGYQGVDDIQVKQTIYGLKIDIFMVGENFKYYSLPFAASTVPDKINLGDFNVFNDLLHPFLINTNGKWTFVSEGEPPQPATCSILK